MHKTKITIRFFLSFLCLLLLAGCESNKEIVHGIDEKEANEIVVYLSNKGIDATKILAAEAGGGGQKIQLYNIMVEEENYIKATSLLNQVGLPRRTSQNLLGIFKESGLVPSELQERVRYQSGLAEQTASTIRKIDGILDAEVQISFPEEDPLNPGQKKGDITASVYVKHSGVLDDPNTHLDTKIRRLVTSSITGLKYDNVTIIPDRARFTEYNSSRSKIPIKN
jgi:type III secretion protein J